MTKSKELMEVEILEKEGRIKNMIDKWQKEYYTLTKELENKKGKDYMKIFTKRAPIADKLYLASLTPEQRDVELKVHEKIASDDAEIRKFVEKLSPKEKDIRYAVMDLLVHCRGAMTSYVGGTEKEVERQTEDLENRAKNLMKKVLEDSGENLDLIKKVFHQKDFLKFDYFKMLYEDYKNGKPMVIIFAHFEKKK